MEKVLHLYRFAYLYGITGLGQMQYVCGRMSRAALYKEPGSRLPAAAPCLGRHAHPAGRSPNSSSLFLPQAAVVAVAQGLFSRRTVRRVLRVALAAFSAAPWQGFEKAERCPSLASLFPPQAAVGSAAVRIHPCVPFSRQIKQKLQYPVRILEFLVGAGGFREPRC